LGCIFIVSVWSGSILLSSAQRIDISLRLDLEALCDITSLDFASSFILSICLANLGVMFPGK